MRRLFSGPAVFAMLALLGSSGAAGAQELRLGPAHNGAWYDPQHPGQGLLVDATAEGDYFFAGWFTYQANTEGDPGAQRWWTIQGPWEDRTTELTVYLTTGGAFLGDFPAITAPAGTARVEFPDCDSLVLVYALDHGEQGSVTMHRLLPVAADHCDAQFVVSDLQETIEADTPVVFRDVSVVNTVEGLPLIEPAPTSVLVTAGVIQQIGAFSSLDIPHGAVVIDGRERFLMAGLVDSHTHLAVNVIELQGSATPQTLELVSTNQLQLYLANGVTTLLNLGDFGEPQNRWAEEIAAGMRIGPSLYTAKYARGDGTSCDGGPAQVAVGNSTEAGRAYVQQAVQDGYRFIKIYNCTPPAAVEGILAEAAALGIPVAGHLPNQVESRTLLLDPAFSLLAHSNAFLWNGYLSTAASNGARNQAVGVMLDGGTALSTTLWIAEKIAQVWCRNQAGIDALLAESPIELMHFTELELHARSVNGGRFAPSGCRQGGFDVDLAFARDMARRVLESGGELLAGTDSPTVLGAAGFSMHDELRALRRAGLTVAQALASATSHAGRYLARVLPAERRLGEVREGFRADLLLLDLPPELAIEDFPASLDLVVTRGAIYPRTVRDTWLERIRAEYHITCPPYCRP